ncbi:MAG: universal stress protein [Thermoleophilia bacterium]
MFNKIMVATDGSDTAKAAVKYAVDIAKDSNSSAVLIVHVCPACTADIDPEQMNLELARKIVSEAEAAFKDSRAKVDTLVEVESPQEALGTALVEIAQREGADLIVLGSRGLSEFRGMLLGSVSSKVVQHAVCPVLVVKEEPTPA